MFFKLCVNNIKKSLKDYTIYFTTLIIAVCVFYVFNSIDDQSAMVELNQSKSEMIMNIVKIMGPISIFVSCILGYLIVYANNFLIRRRKKEFGLYQTLGMSRGGITRILLVETVLIGLLSLGVGLVVGIFASQGISVVVAKMFQADLSNYKFSFSAGAFTKTCIYFGIIYFVVMVLNIISVSRYKLIDLIYASKKNQDIKVKKPIVTIVMFLLSIGLIGYAYYMLKHDQVLIKMDKRFFIMLGMGAVGTYLFFASLAGFLLKMVQMNKRFYLKNLNMFVLRQLNSKINSSTFSITIISLMLFLTIGILATAFSLVSAFNGDMEKQNLTDISFVRYREEGKKMDNGGMIDSFEEHEMDDTKYLKEYAEYSLYEINQEQASMKEFFGETLAKEIKEEFGKVISFEDSHIQVMKQSEYNNLMDLFHKEELKVDLGEQEYVIIANLEQIVTYYKKVLEGDATITISGKEYSPQIKKCIDVCMTNSNMNSEIGTIVVRDTVFQDDFLPISHVLCANMFGTNEEEKENVQEQFELLVDETYKEKDKPFQYSFSKLEMEASSVGLSAMLTFIGLYLGIIFSITSAAILAIGQLSESSDNKERYAVLRKIGADEKMIQRSLFMQIAIMFMLPLTVAIVHSVVGISEMGKIISLVGNMNLTKNIFITALFLIMIYGGYFYTTYLGSKGIIKE